MCIRDSLTLDHGANLADFWTFNKNETQYFLDLMQLERSSSPTLKKILEENLDNLRQDNKRLNNRSHKSTNLSSGLKEALYYSSWHVGAIHALTAIPFFQKAKNIAERLGLGTGLVEKTLEDLETLSLVKRKSNQWIINGPSIHLPRNSPLSQINQSNWRTNAMSHLGKSSGDGKHYSGLLVMSRSDAKKTLAKINEFIKELHSEVESSKEEELVCLNMDYYIV